MDGGRKGGREEGAYQPVNRPAAPGGSWQPTPISHAHLTWAYIELAARCGRVGGEGRTLLPFRALLFCQRQRVPLLVVLQREEGRDATFPCAAAAVLSQTDGQPTSPLHEIDDATLSNHTYYVISSQH